MSTHDFKLYGDKTSDVIITQKELDVKDSRIIVIPNLLSDSGIVSLREQINVVLKSRDEKRNIIFSRVLSIIGSRFDFCTSKV